MIFIVLQMLVSNTKVRRSLFVVWKPVIFGTYRSHMILLILKKKKTFTTDLLLTNPTIVFLNDSWSQDFHIIVSSLYRF